MGAGRRLERKKGVNSLSLTIWVSQTEEKTDVVLYRDKVTSKIKKPFFFLQNNAPETRFVLFQQQKETRKPELVKRLCPFPGLTKALRILRAPHSRQAPSLAQGSPLWRCRPAAPGPPAPRRAALPRTAGPSPPPVAGSAPPARSRRRAGAGPSLPPSGCPRLGAARSPPRRDTEEGSRAPAAPSPAPASP